MPISALPYSDCDCCGYGFEIFEPESYWYLSAGAGGTNSLYKRLRSDLSAEAISTFTDALRISQIDRQGNFYHYNGSTPVLKKYTFDGTLIWSYTPPTPNFDSQYNFDVDNDLNVYIAGSVNLTAGTGGANRESLRLVKLNSSGSAVWTFDKTPPELGAPTAFTQLDPLGVCVDLSGNVHVTGRRLVSNATSTLFQGRFEVHVNSSGTEIWSDLSTGVTGGGVESYGLQCVSDELGNTICRYLPFNSIGAGGSNLDDITLKGYSPSGVVLFTHLNPTVGTGTETEFPVASMIRYFNGFLYCCGPSQNSGDTVVPFFRKFSGSDYTVEDWVDSIPIPKTSPNLALDRSGNVYGLYSRLSPTRTVMRKLSAGGALITTAEISGVVHRFPMVPPGNPIQFFS